MTTFTKEQLAEMAGKGNPFSPNGYRATISDLAAFALAQMEEDFEWVTDKLVQLANRCCEGRVVSVLEGGYDIPAIQRSAVCHVRALLEEITV